ncbi:hypothetical protein ACXDF8_19695 [Mycolicibacterium sp. CBM1]
MTETPESSTDSTFVTPEVPRSPRYGYRDHQPSRLYQVLAWVGIIAGVLFIVTVIFFSGFVFGRASGGYHGWHRGYQGSEMGPEGSMDDCPMMRPGGMGPGGMMGPGRPGPGGMMGPGQPGPGGMMGPQQSPSTAPPTTPRP